MIECTIRIEQFDDYYLWHNNILISDPIIANVESVDHLVRVGLWQPRHSVQLLHVLGAQPPAHRAQIILQLGQGLHTNDHRGNILLLQQPPVTLQFKHFIFWISDKFKYR